MNKPFNSSSVAEESNDFTFLFSFLQMAKIMFTVEAKSIKKPVNINLSIRLQDVDVFMKGVYQELNDTNT